MFFFCQNTDLSQNTDSPLNDRKITDKMMALIRTKCATKHSMTEVAKILGVNPSTLWKHMNKSGNAEMLCPNILNDSSACFFCQNAPLSQISEKTMQRKMVPII